MNIFLDVFEPPLNYKVQQNLKRQKKFKTILSVQKAWKRKLFCLPGYVKSLRVTNCSKNVM